MVAMVSLLDEAPAHHVSLKSCSNINTEFLRSIREHTQQYHQVSILQGISRLVEYLVCLPYGNTRDDVTVRQQQMTIDDDTKEADDNWEPVSICIKATRHNADILSRRDEVNELSSIHGELFECLPERLRHPTLPLAYP